MPLSIGVLKETSAHEARVALTPDVAAIAETLRGRYRPGAALMM